MDFSIYREKRDEIIDKYRKKEISYEELEKELENLIKVYGGDI